MIFSITVDSAYKTLSFSDIALDSEDNFDPELPRLGEIIDYIALEKPDYEIRCDPSLRNMRVIQVRIQIG